ncbi:hypothetical protein KCM76_12565 [Zooshikella marina]|uniref:Flagellar protein FliT n=1 Tax=Zooshikella ganghwensis TaxID=202772 RepID=A0A4P9VN94_9GAMM|nr:hypothetical protein [Zooshikella ganghwensis]MBU2706818.1 hypothetical protein [Zooshikella ganghwensis]RDH43570.1 hypothetical protein B9G39_09010 [Zooshikella ganghwensis]
MTSSGRGSLGVAQLEQLQSDLQNALLNQDWSSVTDLDERCRHIVGTAMQQGAPADLLVALGKLLSTYQHVINACAAQKESLGAELHRLQRHQQGVAIYQQMQ